METLKKLWAKVMELLGSRKFWLATIIAILAILKLNPITQINVIGIVQIWLGTILGVGLIQGTAKRIGGWNDLDKLIK